MSDWLRRFGLIRDDGFDEFRDAVRSSFAFLQSDLGFRLTKDSAWAYEISFRYERESARLDVGYESLSHPWVTVSLRLDGSWKPFWLSLILEQALGTSAALDAALGAPSLTEKIQRMAALTHTYARPLLAGDATAIAAVRKFRAERLPEQAKEMRERHWKMGFTSAGESPRFQARPTLAQLFAGTPNDDHRMVRIYEAVWDHHYPLDELAAFLGMTKDNVQGELERWDHLTVGEP